MPAGVREGRIEDIRHGQTGRGPLDRYVPAQERQQRRFAASSDWQHALQTMRELCFVARGAVHVGLRRFNELKFGKDDRSDAISASTSPLRAPLLTRSFRARRFFHQI